MRLRCAVDVLDLGRFRAPDMLANALELRCGCPGFGSFLGGQYAWFWTSLHGRGKWHVPRSFTMAISEIARRLKTKEKRRMFTIICCQGSLWKHGFCKERNFTRRPLIAFFKRRFFRFGNTCGSVDCGPVERDKLCENIAMNEPFRMKWAIPSPHPCFGKCVSVSADPLRIISRHKSYRRGRFSRMEFALKFGNV